MKNQKSENTKRDDRESALQEKIYESGIRWRAGR